jgi:nicotinate-nucleotide--dimethylbenzimidazole phosphoribosyltransferase
VTDGSALPSELREAIAAIGPLDAASAAAATDRLNRLTKPPGSLGRLETLAIQLAGIRGQVVGGLDHPAIAVFAGDHGITAQGVSPYPSDVTRQMVANFLAGGAAINVLASAAAAELVVVDVGIAGRAFTRVETGVAGRNVRFVDARVAAGSRDFLREPAMTRDEVAGAMVAGARTVRELAETGCDLLGVGEMGIGNTTAASAIVAALTGLPPRVVTGAGTGLDAAGIARKAAVVERALARHGIDLDQPVEVLAAVGGLEIAALVGAIIAAAGRAIPVILDGFITGAAALVAARLAPKLPPRLIASHRSAEPGHRVVLGELGLEPLLDLGLRLGEGTGAALAIPIVVAAARIVGEMATFADAGISDRD